MNSKERVFGTMQGQAVDRRPFTALLSLYGSKLINCPRRQYYTDAAAYGRGQTAIRETFQPDILFAPFSLVALAEAFGGEVRYFDNQPPNLLRPPITSAGAISRLTAPDIDAHPRIVYLRDGLRRVVEAHSREAAVASILLSPVDLPLMIMGIEGWMETVLFDEDGVKRMLELTTPFFLQYANALLEDGVDVLILPAAFLTPTLSTRQIVKRFTLPVLQEVFARVQGPMVIHHIGSLFLKYVDLCTGLPNGAGCALDHQDDLTVARDKAGPGATLLGGPDGPNLGQRLPEEIEAQCIAFLKDRRQDPRFILSTSGSDVALDTPRENIHAMRKAVETFKERDDD